MDECEDACVRWKAHGDTGEDRANRAEELYRRTGGRGIGWQYGVLGLILGSL